ncbi:hypothetical protein [Streptomyces sp. G-G2]|uniref:hypothetical protein n=1 Tax=Streptomyces sp. G-G2 TaxID=3046201 RepID=UPI0024B9A442|nr:hypothetical protein [Streptomyces sp. G-G2]MDJ0382359.1 hypothetical protein [Streptomyces sp. G-G2]
MPALPVPDLPVPARWARTLDDWPARVPSQLAEGLVATRRSGRLDELRRGDEQYPDFTASLRAALAGSARSVTLSFSEPRWTLAVVSAAGALLGHVDHPADPTLGGSVSEVPTGGADRYEQNWHTDSTPWATPNRWTILGLLCADPALHEPATGVLPWDEVDAAWPGAAEVLGVLRDHDVAWRLRYPGLAQLRAPVRGAVPRWFRPALDEVIGGGPPAVSLACRSLERAVDGATRWYEAVVAPSRVLVFDNYAALHRGPAIKEPSARTLLRFKAGGSPGRPMVEPG